MTVAVVVGMASEKAVVGERPGIQVIVGAGNALALASRLEATIAAGADRILSIGVCGALAPQLQRRNRRRRVSLRLWRYHHPLR